MTTGIKLSKDSIKMMKGLGDDLLPALKVGMKEAMIDLEGYVKEKKLSGQVLKRRTGGLRGSIETNVRVRGKKVIGAIGSRKKSAAIHEFGGTIHAKAGGWLTIPLDAAKTAGGVARGRARSFKNTFFIKSKRGNLLLVQSKGRGRGKRIVPLFVLKRSVKIPERSYLRTGLLERLSVTRNIITASIIRAFKKA